MLIFDKNKEAVMKAAIKKIVALGVATVMLIVCIILAASAGTSSIAGPAGGKDAEIQNIKDFAKLLGFFAYRAEYDEFMEDLIDEGYDLDDIPDELMGELLSAFEPAYKSATVNIKTNIYATSDSTNSKYTNGMVSATQTVDRDLTLYMTDTCTFYVSRGMTSVQTDCKDPDDYSTWTNSTYCQWDVQIYVNAGEDTCFINITELLYATASKNQQMSSQLKANNAGKWFELPISMVDYLIDIDYENRVVAEDLGELIEELVEEEIISERSDKVTLDQHDFKEVSYLLGNKIDDKDTEAEFEIDLSDSTTPKVRAFVLKDTSETEDVGEHESVTLSQYLRSEQTFVFSNIGNTAISFDESRVDEILKDEDDFEKLFKIEEIKEEEDDEDDE